MCTSKCVCEHQLALGVVCVYSAHTTVFVNYAHVHAAQRAARMSQCALAVHTVLT
jgi:hypothetical protein